MNSLSKFLVDSILDDNPISQSDTIPTVDVVISKELVENWVVHKFPKLLNEISNTTPGVTEVDDGPNFFFKNYKTFDKVSKIRAQKIGYEVLRQLTDEKFEDITVYREYPNGPVKAVTHFPAGVIGKVTATNQKDFDDERAYILWHRHVTRLMGLVGWTLVNDIRSDREDREFSVRFTHDLYTDETSEDSSSVNESKFFTKEELQSITDDIIGGLDELMIGYEGEEDRRKREKRLKKLRKDLDKTTPTTEEKTPKSFDRLDFYLNYYKNVSPSSFNITKEDKDIRIQLEGSINEDVDILPTSLNIPRHKMPQVSSKNMSDYIQFLKSRGIRVGTKMVRVSDVKMTQKEVDKEKIRNLVQSDKREHLLKPVILSKDGYIIDGHHRVLALYNLDKYAKIKTIHVQLPVKELLRITFDYPKVFTKNINEGDDVMKLGFKGSEIGKEIQRMETQRYMNEDITIPVEVGDTILTGRFKNKKTTVKSIDTDEHGMPTINGRKVVTFRKLSDINEAEFILKPGFQFVAQKTIGDIKRGVKYVLKAVDGSIGKLVFTVKPASKNELIPVKSRSYSEFYSTIMGVNEGVIDGGEPEAMYIPDYKIRNLNKERPEPWFKQMGYIQMDFPKADSMRGRGKSKDTESTFRKVSYKTTNKKISKLKDVLKPVGTDKWIEINDLKKD